MAKTASRNAFLANKSKFKARFQMLQSDQHRDDHADSYNGDDIFQLQHHHLLACLEHTTVIDEFRIHRKAV